MACTEPAAPLLLAPHTCHTPPSPTPPVGLWLRGCQVTAWWLVMWLPECSAQLLPRPGKGVAPAGLGHRFSRLEMLSVGSGPPSAPRFQPSVRGPLTPPHQGSCI